MAPQQHRLLFTMALLGSAVEVHSLIPEVAKAPSRFLHVHRGSASPRVAKIRHAVSCATSSGPSLVPWQRCLRGGGTAALASSATWSLAHWSFLASWREVDCMVMAASLVGLFAGSMSPTLSTAPGTIFPPPIQGNGSIVNRASSAENRWIRRILHKLRSRRKQKTASSKTFVVDPTFWRTSAFCGCFVGMGGAISSVCVAMMVGFISGGIVLPFFDAQLILRYWHPGRFQRTSAGSASILAETKRVLPAPGNSSSAARGEASVLFPGKGGRLGLAALVSCALAYTACAALESAAAASRVSSYAGGAGKALSRQCSRATPAALWTSSGLLAPSPLPVFRSKLRLLTSLPDWPLAAAFATVVHACRCVVGSPLPPTAVTPLPPCASAFARACSQASLGLIGVSGAAASCADGGGVCSGVVLRSTIAGALMTTLWMRVVAAAPPLRFGPTMQVPSTATSSAAPAPNPGDATGARSGETLINELHDDRDSSHSDSNRMRCVSLPSSWNLRARLGNSVTAASLTGLIAASLSHQWDLAGVSARASTGTAATLQAQLPGNGHAACFSAAVSLFGARLFLPPLPYARSIAAPAFVGAFVAMSSPAVLKGAGRLNVKVASEGANDFEDDDNERRRRALTDLFATVAGAAGAAASAAFVQVVVLGGTLSGGWSGRLGTAALLGVLLYERFFLPAVLRLVSLLRSLLRRQLCRMMWS